jgi:hypothetical protein
MCASQRRVYKHLPASLLSSLPHILCAFLQNLRGWAMECAALPHRIIHLSNHACEAEEEYINTIAFSLQLQYINTCCGVFLQNESIASLWSALLVLLSTKNFMHRIVSQRQRRVYKTHSGPLLLSSVHLHLLLISKIPLLQGHGVFCSFSSEQKTPCIVS